MIYFGWRPKSLQELKNVSENWLLKLVYIGSRKSCKWEDLSWAFDTSHVFAKTSQSPGIGIGITPFIPLCSNAKAFICYFWICFGAVLFRVSKGYLLTSGWTLKRVGTLNLSHIHLWIDFLTLWSSICYTRPSELEVFPENQSLVKMYSRHLINLSITLTPFINIAILSF